MTNTSEHSSSGSGGGSSSASGVGQQARQFADDVKQAAESSAEAGKDRGAERLKDVAATVDRVADQVAEEAPAMADWVRKAASEIDGVSRSLKDKSVGELLTMGKDFARREPAAFIAASAVAGFALSRLLKSTSSAASTSSPSTSPVQPSAPPVPAHLAASSQPARPDPAEMAYHPGDGVRPTPKPAAGPSTGKPTEGAHSI
ncbi:hypothetical protein IHQ68_12675 [Chelatococcus sambhunathii]|uniref:Membrane-anchored ribosome-binding protein, inhibits growth in stationary phase, ElaB/YqjD/DUF883 family n=1 Tax=Chelatococcus sambhunathii TaxID=363953 RepID=A0ABU1DH76_9HYPH|nr:hypothetical protein [Chelatococcus sambhunathii]MDR4307472.1 hypothetical protein [Chelatococcus sambhunathii]